MQVGKKRENESRLIGREASRQCSRISVKQEGKVRELLRFRVTATISGFITVLTSEIQLHFLDHLMLFLIYVPGCVFAYS